MEVFLDGKTHGSLVGPTGEFLSREKSLKRKRAKVVGSLEKRADQKGKETPRRIILKEFDKCIISTSC